MKKVIVVLILIVVSVVFFMSYSSRFSPEEILNDVLSELLVFDFEEMKELESEEISEHQKQSMKKLKNHFTDRAFEKLSLSLSNFTSIYTFYQLRCSTEVIIIEYDTRELDTSTVVYYTVHLKLLYEDNNKEDEVIQLEGTTNMIKEDKSYKIKSIQLNTRSIKNRRH